MRQEILKVKKNTPLNSSVYELVLSGASPMQAGQFLELKIGENFLRRPFSVADYQSNELTIIYKVVGRGTEFMTTLEVDDQIDALCQLGNTFDLDKTNAPVLIGGGVGIAPIYFLAKSFKNKGITPTVIMGYRTSVEAFYIDKFKKISKVLIASEDGSLGIKGNVVDIFKDYKDSFYYACGPLPMLKALSNVSTFGEVSLEARMGCGFGACMGCTIMTKNGYKRVCKEGTVFDACEVIYE